MTEEEFSTAYIRHYSRTVLFLSSRGVHSTLQHDIAQSAWAKGWQYRLQLRNKSLLSTWVNSIALNLYYQEYNRIKRAGAVELKPSNHPLTYQNTSAVEVDQLVSRCRQKDRGLLKMTLQGLTGTDIADRLGITPTSARLRVMYAKRRAREAAL